MIYIDDWRQSATVGGISSRWSHLTADTLPELHAFAASLGLRRSWFQSGVRHTSPHYDLTEGMRQRAIGLGATAESWRDAGLRMIRTTRTVRVTMPDAAEFTLRIRGGEIIRVTGADTEGYLGKDERRLAAELRAQGAKFTSGQ